MNALRHGKWLWIGGLAVSLALNLWQLRTRPISATASARPAAPVADHVQPPAAEITALQSEVRRLQQRLDQLEPPSPTRVDTPPLDDQAQALLAPAHVRQVLADGKPLPFGLVAVSKTWQPPQYVPSWHSTSYNRFAAVSTIAASARHRFQVQTVFQGSLATATASLIGLDGGELQTRPCGETPAYPCGSPADSSGSWEVYALQAHVEAVRQQGPLVVFKVQPLLQGCEVIWLDKAVLHPALAALGDPQKVWAAFTTSDGAVWETMPVWFAG